MGSWKVLVAGPCASEAQARGVGAGDVVVFQLPNWAEAGITFWAAGYLGAVVVPVVHFYGAKEVDYILRTTVPDVVRTDSHNGVSVQNTGPTAHDDWRRDLWTNGSQMLFVNDGDPTVLAHAFGTDGVRLPIEAPSGGPG